MAMFQHSKLLNDIFQRVLETPEKIAIISGDKTLTYQNLWLNIQKSAFFLQKLNLKPGERIALSAKKNTDFVILYLAAHALGITCVVVDSETNQTRLDYILHAVSPSHLFGFTSDEFLSSEYPDLNEILFQDNTIFLANPSLSEDDESDILFTTGTTGAPKGVILTHRNIYASVENINGFIGNESSDVEAIGLPLCHSFGLGRLRCALVRGQTVVLLGSFANLKKVFAAFEQYDVTGFGMVPSVWAFIEKFSGTRISRFASQLHYIEIGSAPMPIETKLKLCELFPTTRICMHYGLTEASRSLFIEFHQQRDHLNSIGIPASDQVSVKIFDETGCEKSTGETGELCIQGLHITSHPYLNDHKKIAFFGDYFRTGDLGRKDKDGFVYLVGRLKEMINVGGKKVAPAEVEDAICRLGATDAVCVGVPDPNGILGEVIKAYILRQNCSLDFKEIVTGLRQELEPYKIPTFLEWIDEIPKTASGKKQRLLLK